MYDLSYIGFQMGYLKPIGFPLWSSPHKIAGKVTESSLSGHFTTTRAHDTCTVFLEVLALFSFDHDTGIRVPW